MMKLKMSLLTACMISLCGLSFISCGGGGGGSDDPGPVDEQTDVGPLESGALRIAVVDSLTDRYIKDCKIIVSTAGKNETKELELQKNGRYQAKGFKDSDVLTVTVFHNEYNYVTVSGLKARDLVVPLRRLVATRRGGLTGSLETWPAAGDSSTLSVGAAALALQGNILDFDRGTFLGDQTDADFAFPSWLATIVQNVAPGTPLIYPLQIPGSVMMGNKTEFSVFGIPTSCDDAESERAGTCGRHAAFSAYASISGFTDPIVAELYDEDAQDLVVQLVDILEHGAEFDLGSMLPKALPILPKLLRHVSLDFASNLEITYGADGQELFRHDFYPNRKMDQTRRISVPEAPMLMKNERADLVGAIAVADLGSQGMVPFGIGAGAAENSQSFDISVADGGIALQGAKTRLVAFALDSDISKSTSNPDIVPVFSVLLTSLDGDLPADGASVTGKFLGAPDSSDFAASVRTFYSLPALEGASLYRAEVKGDGRQWVTYFAPGLETVTLPKVPEGFQDVIVPDKNAHTMIAISLKNGMSMDSLFEDNEVNENDMNDAMAGFSYAVHYDFDDEE